VRLGRGRAILKSDAKMFGDEFVAEQPRLFARRFRREAPQQREKRRNFAQFGILAAGQHALDHAPLEPRQTARLG
jgi:hypothetical protein